MKVRILGILAAALLGSACGGDAPSNEELCERICDIEERCFEPNSTCADECEAEAPDMSKKCRKHVASFLGCVETLSCQEIENDDPKVLNCVPDGMEDVCDW